MAQDLNRRPPNYAPIIISKTVQNRSNSKIVYEYSI